MLKKSLRSINSENNNSVLYLALLCLLYFFITSNYFTPDATSGTSLQNSKAIYIEITEEGTTTVKSFTNPGDLHYLRTTYALPEDLKSGDSLIVTEDSAQTGRISGRKKISLGIPIGINSAGANDLKAIPGIGDELAGRIISYREVKRGLKSLDELDSVEGIGEKKLANIKKLANLD